MVAIPASALPDISPDPEDDSLLRLPRSWPGRFHCDSEPKRFPAITLINSHDQTGRQCSDDCTMEATSAGLMASEALHMKLWRTILNLSPGAQALGVFEKCEISFYDTPARKAEYTPAHHRRRRENM